MKKVSVFRCLLNTFAFIRRVEELSGEKLTFYSIVYEGEDKHLFEKFVQEHQERDDLEEDLGSLMSWLEHLKEIGAKAHLFR